jgi:hypothetical protein
MFDHDLYGHLDRPVLHRGDAGEIELPPVRRRILGQRRTGRPRPETVPIDTTPLKMPLRALGAIEMAKPVIRSYKPRSALSVM